MYLCQNVIHGYCAFQVFWYESEDYRRPAGGGRMVDLSVESACIG